jgi:hypothetical protein
MDETDAGDGRWLTYGQLAEARQIGKRAAVRLAQRHRLRRQPGNDGQTRVWVPTDMATSSPHRPTPPATDTDDTSPGVASPFHAKALAVLETALADASRRADAALALADSTMARLADAEAHTNAAIQRAERAEAAISGERVRADTLRARVEEAEGRATAVAARAEQAEARADQERLAADRFRAEVEAARAEAAVAQEAAEARLSKAVETHGSELAGLRVRADEAVARAERVESERDVAREAHQRAMQANRKWEAADAARKARGRLRRAWDGWRGR